VRIDRLRLARPRARFDLVVALSACLSSGCGAGLYGFSRTYEPLISERSHLEKAQELPLEDVRKAPYDFKNVEVAWFGVVQSIHDLPDKRTELYLAGRIHQARHLCKDEYQDSCRMTVSESSPGNFVARLKLNEDERSGKERVWVGSLLKIYGVPTGDYDEQGDPVLETTYHRHWPRGYYVTTAQRAAMTR
jgi:hypothetical protein